MSSESRSKITGGGDDIKVGIVTPVARDDVIVRLDADADADAAVSEAVVVRGIITVSDETAAPAASPAAA